MGRGQRSTNTASAGLDLRRGSTGDGFFSTPAAQPASPEPAFQHGAAGRAAAMRSAQPARWSSVDYAELDATGPGETQGPSAKITYRDDQQTVQESLTLQLWPGGKIAMQVNLRETENTWKRSIAFAPADVLAALDADTEHEKVALKERRDGTFELTVRARPKGVVRLTPSELDVVRSWARSQTETP